jgi:hypothetical protein
VTVNAQPYFKRVLAERAILELKLRMALRLNFLGIVTFWFVSRKHFDVFFLGQSLRFWKDELDFVLNTINNKLSNVSRMAMLTSYFTRPRAISLPQTASKLYKYNIGEIVRIDLNKSQRQFPFKYSLSGGKSKNLKCQYK